MTPSLRIVPGPPIGFVFVHKSGQALVVDQAHRASQSDAHQQGAVACAMSTPAEEFAEAQTANVDQFASTSLWPGRPTQAPAASLFGGRDRTEPPNPLAPRAA